MGQKKGVFSQMFSEFKPETDSGANTFGRERGCHRKRYEAFIERGREMVFTAQCVVISPIRKISFDASSTAIFCPISLVSLAVKYIVFYIFYL